MKNILLAGLGGGIGCILRYLTQKLMSILTNTPFPAGTFIVNATVCFLIGLFFSLASKNESFNSDWQLFLMTGLCGGFTTFSAFTLEGMGLLKQDKTGLFLIYIGGSVLAGLTATWLGIKMAK
jgi:CrcB protein